MRGETECPLCDGPVTFTFTPGEPATRDYPGCGDMVEDIVPECCCTTFGFVDEAGYYKEIERYVLNNWIPPTAEDYL